MVARIGVAGVRFAILALHTRIHTMIVIVARVVGIHVWRRLMWIGQHNLWMTGNRLHHELTTNRIELLYDVGLSGWRYRQPVLGMELLLAHDGRRVAHVIVRIHLLL